MIGNHEYGSAAIEPFPAVRPSHSMADLIHKRAPTSFQFVTQDGAPGTTSLWCNVCAVTFDPKAVSGPEFIVDFEPYSYDKADWNRTTLDIRTRLRAAGTRFYHDEKAWRVKLTPENCDALLGILRDYAFKMDAPTYEALKSAAIEATEAHAHDGAPECGDLSEVTEGWEPSEREPMSPFGAMVFGIGAEMMRRQAEAFAEARR